MSTAALQVALPPTGAAILPQLSVQEMHRGAADSDIPVVLAKAVREGVLGTATGQPAALFYDVDAYRSTLQGLNAAFGEHFVHCKAVKSNPLAWAMRESVSQGLGLECASLNEVMHSLRSGAPAEHVIFDSPCKTRADIKICLELGVHINCDNLDELERVIEARSELLEEGGTTSATVGVRINPLLGMGQIAALSVSNVESKFAVPLTDDNRTRLLSYFKEHPWLCCIHVHVGSQGCPLSMLADGAKIAVDLADEIDVQAGRQQVSIVDIGGGLPVNFEDARTSPNFFHYAQALADVPSSLFSNKTRKIFTEFGRAIDAKVGWFASEIEYVKQAGPQKKVAIIHGGSDVFVRECYAPTDFEKRVSAFRKDGMALTDTTQLFDIAGPLCFGGDKVRRDIQFANVSEGDYVVVHDTGANCLSLFSRHCSRGAPPVLGYWRDDSAEDGFALSVIKEGEEVDDVLSFWGADTVRMV